MFDEGDLYDQRVTTTPSSGADAVLTSADPAREGARRRNCAYCPAATHSGKRALDILGAALLLIFLAPFMLIVSLLLFCEGRGPVLFRQRRSGLHGDPFPILKFRTMSVCEDGDEIRAATHGDQRITPMGAWLRKLSIDELPQLINVLRGEMSLVGPRPHALAHDAMFSMMAPHYPERFLVKPGITGLAQVRGQRGSIANAAALKIRLQSDIEYIEGWSMLGDFRILLRSVRILFQFDGS